MEAVTDIVSELDELTLPNVDAQRSAGSEMRRATLADRKRQNHLAAADKKRQAGLATAASPEAAANLALKQAYIRGWQYVQEGAEDLAISFADFMLISGPVAVGIYLIRLVIGVFFSGGPTIGWKNIQVSLVPGYGIVEGAYRTIKIVYIAAVSGFLYGAILMALFALTHPGDVLSFVGGSILNIFKLLINFFGVG